MKNETNPLGMFTPQEAADYLNISVVTLHRYLKQKKNPLPFYRLSSRSIRIKKQDLEFWMKRKL